LYTKRRASATLKVVRQDLIHFAAWWEHTRRRTFDPALLRHEDLRGWQLARQRDDGAAPASINRSLASLHGYCQQATIVICLQRTLPPILRAFPPIRLRLAHCLQRLWMRYFVLLGRNNIHCFERGTKQC
jgi:hypothetical protein